jgi:hypothetical protein
MQKEWHTATKPLKKNITPATATRMRIWKAECERRGTLLPTDRLSGRVTQKGPSLRPENLRQNFSKIFQKGRKGVKF